MHLKTYTEVVSNAKLVFNIKNGYKDGNDFQYNVYELQA